MTHHIRAVLFDLDGVVVFTDAYHYRAWKRLADEQGWEFDEEVNNACRGVPRMASLQVILDHNGVDLPEDEKTELATRKNDYYRQSLAHIGPGDLYPGVVPFLEALQTRGVTLALCSSSKNAQTVLDALDLNRFFATVISGNDITHAKPDPEIFLLASRRLRIPPFHCIVFEDAPSGVAAAHAAGMKCIGVGDAKLLSEALVTITDYAQIDIDAMLDTGRTSTVATAPWSVAQDTREPRRAQYWETIFTLSNGYMGLRGTWDEEDAVIDPHACPGFFINGIYDYEPYEHVISFPGYPSHTHAMLNLADWRIINLDVNGRRVGLDTGTFARNRRCLDLRRGVLHREAEWTGPEGARVRIESTRVVSMARRHSAAVSYTVTPLEGVNSLMLESRIKGCMPSQALHGRTLVKPRRTRVAGDKVTARYATATSGFEIGMACGHVVDAAGSDVQCEVQRDADVVTFRYSVNAPAERVRLDKHAAFHASIETAARDVVRQASRTLAHDISDGFAALLSEQARWWQRYWDMADISITGNEADQQAVRFCLFHLRQSNPEDNQRSIGANGITGDKYCGHVFWDTEMYMLPHFLYTEPEICRPLLMYRYNLLERARQRAREMAGVGALYAWNSISGEECGVVYEAATAEYHLLSAIAYGIARYVDATGDDGFLFEHGAEMLFETSRFLVDRGAYVPTKGDRFCLNVVCGPDEYGCGVNNNCYTNVMAQWHFRFATDVHARMQRECPDRLAELCARLGLEAPEVDSWRAAAERMYIPWNEELGIHPQDDSFLHLDPVDMDLVPRHTDIRDTTHPLNLWRMQVAKQADVVLLMFVQGAQYDLETKRRNYEFYEPRTCHGSSLSACMHAVMAVEVGKIEDAYDYFRQSARMDLNDFKDNTAFGVHSASLGGTWMAIVNGFGGMRDYADGLQFAPVLPQEWEGCTFKVLHHGARIEVAITPDGVTYRLINGSATRFTSHGEEVSLTPEAPEWKSGVGDR